MDPLVCLKCRARLPVVDAPQVVCSVCFTPNPVSSERRATLTATSHTDEERERCAAGFTTVPPALPRAVGVAFAYAPGTWLLGALLALAALGVTSVSSRSQLPRQAALFVWAPVVALSALAEFARAQAVRRARFLATRRSLAAVRTAQGPTCRSCGSLLAASGVLSRCPFCSCDNLVDEQLLEARNGDAIGPASAVEALVALERPDAVFEGARRRRAVLVGAHLLPLAWSFLPALRQSDWTFAAGVSVWLLSLSVLELGPEARSPGAGARPLGAQLLLPLVPTTCFLVVAGLVRWWQ